MIIVTAAIIRHNHRYLITRRAPGKHLAGYWEFPGGKIEPGESPQQCLARELKEELGIEVAVGDFFMENLHRYDNHQILLKAYFCKHISGKIVLKDHDRAKWITLEEFQNYQFAPADVPFVKDLEKYGI